MPAQPGPDVFACGHCLSYFHLACLENVPAVCPVCGEACDASMAAESSRQPLLQFPDCDFHRLKPSMLYRFSLVVVSLALILLPAIYLGLVGLFVYGLVLYAIRFHGMVGSLGFGSVLLVASFWLYVMPLFIGAMMTFFLVKPFFAPRAEEEEAFCLNHADAPELFALVGWICRSLDAPIPSRIDLNCQVNAGAAFRGGWRSLFGNDIRLIIGLPVIAGMDVSQLAGIIAHEFGHFSQGSAMRAGFVIDSVNRWFYRVVNERDKWDLSLEYSSEHEDQKPMMAVLLYMTRFGIWLSRRVTWVFMIAGRALSCWMSRQMEFDADRYEIRMIGGEAFEGVTHRLWQLHMGFGPAIKQMRETWKRERKLLDQIPEYVVTRANEISAEAQDKFRASLAKSGAGLFSTHPEDSERIARAKESGEQGIFHCDLPATALFSDFSELSRRFTLGYYQAVFGRQIPVEQLVSTRKLASRVEHDYAADDAQIRGYFLGVVTQLRPVFVTESKQLHVLQPGGLVQELAKACGKMDELAEPARAALADFLAWEKRLELAKQAAELLQAGFQFDPAEFGIEENDSESAQTEATAGMQECETKLRPFEEAAKARLNTAIQVLRLPQFAADLPDAAKLQDEAKAMIWVLSRLVEVFGPLLELRALSATLEMVLEFRSCQFAAENVPAVLENLCTEIQERVNAIQEKTSQLRYPFHHTKENVMVSEYARNTNYHPDPVEAARREARSHVEKLLNLHSRLLARLIAIAGQVEGVFLVTK